MSHLARNFEGFHPDCKVDLLNTPSGLQLVCLSCRVLAPLDSVSTSMDTNSKNPVAIGALCVSQVLNTDPAEPAATEGDS